MTRFLLLSLTILFLLNTTQAQDIDFGFQAGIAPTSEPGTNYIFVNRSDPRHEFTFNAIKVHNAIYVGGFTEFRLNEPFFVKAEFMYNQFNTDYELNFLGTDFPRSSTSTIYSETIRQFDLPVSIGVDLGNFDVTSGFTAHLLLNQDTELEQIPGYAKAMDPVRFGFHSGVGFNYSPVKLQFRYVMDFFTYGDHMTVNGQNLSLDNTPGRILGTLSYQF